MTAFLHANQVADVKQFAWPIYSIRRWLISCSMTRPPFCKGCHLRDHVFRCALIRHIEYLYIPSYRYNYEDTWCILFCCWNEPEYIFRGVPLHSTVCFTRLYKLLKTLKQLCIFHAITNYEIIFSYWQSNILFWCLYCPKHSTKLTK